MLKNIADFNLYAEPKPGADHVDIYLLVMEVTLKEEQINAMHHYDTLVLGQDWMINDVDAVWAPDRQARKVFFFDRDTVLLHKLKYGGTLLQEAKVWVRHV